MVGSGLRAALVCLAVSLVLCHIVSRIQCALVKKLAAGLRPFRLRCLVESGQASSGSNQSPANRRGPKDCCRVTLSHVWWTQRAGCNRIGQISSAKYDRPSSSPGSLAENQVLIFRYLSAVCFYLNTTIRRRNTSHENGESAVC
jgi:hypothetical protein